MNLRIKQFINLFIPPIFVKIYKNFKTLKFSFLSTINQISHSKKSIYILGNGPSLSKSIGLMKERLIENDCMVVNNFCNSILFQEIKPRYYVIADPSNLGQLDKLSTSLKLETINIVESLSRVNWELILIVPDFAINSYLINSLKNHNFIKIHFYNTKNISKSSNKLENWEKNYIAPPAQTVLNTCVYLGIFLKYEEINILGMDMSWHEDLELDQKSNVLYILDKHFYGTERRLAVLDLEGKTPAKVHEYLQCSVNALRSFWELKEYADYKKIKIYNYSPHSWVDAFARKMTFQEE